MRPLDDFPTRRAEERNFRGGRIDPGTGRTQLVTIGVVVLLMVSLGCRRSEKKLSSNLNLANKVAVRTVRLYFESSDLLLVPEQRNIALPENPAGALSFVVRELMKGSANAAVPKLMPPDSVVRAAYLLPDGTAFVDLGGPTLSQGWPAGSHEELMALGSIVQTITANFPEAKRVRFLVNGEPAETLAGHISLARAMLPDPSFVDPRGR